MAMATAIGDTEVGIAALRLSTSMITPTDLATQSAIMTGTSSNDIVELFCTLFWLRHIYEYMLMMIVW